jgi:hypothetical protein
MKLGPVLRHRTVQKSEITLPDHQESTPKISPPLVNCGGARKTLVGKLDFVGSVLCGQ